MKKLYLIAVILFLLASLGAGLVEVSVQQSLRQGANDPQIQMAEDVASALSAGAKPGDVVPTINVDISASLAPFLILYDDKGEPLAGNAILDKAAPKLPSGVFDYVKNNGEDRITWQPKPDVRMAIVVDRFENSQLSGYVVAGRSLREVEKREDKLGQEVLIAWIVSILIIGVGIVAGKFTSEE